MKTVFKLSLLVLLVLLIIFSLRYVSLFEVTSASMEPVIRMGSVIVSIKTNGVKQNDIIVYKTLQNTIPITHRIIKILNVHGKIFYITKGDNNAFEDPYPISKTEILGKVVFILPYLGKILRTISSYKLLSITFYGPIGFLLGTSIKKLLKSI